jgi:hypothetical protein
MFGFFNKPLRGARDVRAYAVRPEDEEGFRRGHPDAIEACRFIHHATDRNPAIARDLAAVQIRMMERNPGCEIYFEVTP